MCPLPDCAVMFCIEGLLLERVRAPLCCAVKNGLFHLLRLLDLQMLSEFIALQCVLCCEEWPIPFIEVMAEADYGRCILQCEVEPHLFSRAVMLVLYVLSTLLLALGRGRLIGVIHVGRCWATVAPVEQRTPC
ncbi:hypothetical protein Nepgr_033692 [Nepenthes gracilis]|uniref:Uncharacterized protein n=1 Tax=Nepenthes gracilis TaxID=150966 RepID=A0AAD3TL28_NEPGR|nr:hypothetical protein Nepgr_033692 [Nepenthes gracilis]